jgi:CelD/BcsL family acetyltransferase involved in cellulose biosynthesis
MIMRHLYMINRSEAYRNVDVAILDEDRQFAMLEEEWEELYRHSPAATPFQSWAWLYSWWEYYGGGYELRLVTIRSEDGLLVALLPLMLERRGRLGKLLLVGSGITDYLDVLVREGWEDRVADPGAQALDNIGSWQVADLQMLHPEAAAWSFFAGRRGPRAAVQQSNCYVIGVRPWDEVLMSLSRKWRKTARTMLRRMEADGLRRGIAGQREAEKAGRTLVALHRTVWEGRNIAPAHLTRTFEDHIATTARRMTSSGLGGISEFKQGETTVVSSFLIFGRSSVGAYTVGASREAMKSYQWSSLYIWDGLDIAASRDSRYLDLLEGGDEYKLRWASEVVTNSRLILSGNPLFWALYAGYHVMRSKTRAYLHSEDAPQWLKDAAAHVLYQLRHRAPGRR